MNRRLGIGRRHLRGFGGSGGGGAPAAPTVSIAGTVAHGSVLTATAVGATSYQWYAGAVAITGETASTLTVDRADGGFANGLTCRATGPGGTTISNVLTWLPASSVTSATLTGEFLDTAVASPGGLVPAWINSVGGGANLAQGTAANQPTHIVGGGPNGHDAIDFTVSAVSRTLAANLGFGAACSVAVVARVPAAGVRLVYDGNVAGDTRALYNPGAGLTLYSGASGCTVASPAPGSWAASTAVFNGASSAQTVNGASATGNAGAATSTGLTFGGRFGATAAQGFNDRAAYALTWAGALSASDRLDCDAYLREWAAL